MVTIIIYLTNFVSFIQILSKETRKPSNAGIELRPANGIQSNF
jgi:hypothetical protein